jgi:ankyrin repeat protein
MKVATLNEQLEAIFGRISIGGSSLEAMLSCEKLVKEGADIAVVPQVSRRALLHTALFHGHQDFARILINSNAFRRDTIGHIVLDDACSTGSLDLVKRLLAAGADPNWHNRKGLMPIHTAAAVGRADVCELLIRAGVDPNAKTLEGTPVIFVAAGSGHLQTCIELIGLGADPAMKSGRMSLWGYASLKRHKDVGSNLKALVDARAAASAIHLAMGKGAAP